MSYLFCNPIRLLTTNISDAYCLRSLSVSSFNGAVSWIRIQRLLLIILKLSECCSLVIPDLSCRTWSVIDNTVKVEFELNKFQGCCFWCLAKWKTLRLVLTVAHFLVWKKWFVYDIHTRQNKNYLQCLCISSPEALLFHSNESMNTYTPSSRWVNEAGNSCCLIVYIYSPCNSGFCGTVQS